MNEQISKAILPDDIRINEKNMIIEVLKKLKSEFIRIEEIKHKDTNIQKLDEKAVLLNLKKEEDTNTTENNNNTNNNSNQLAANVSNFTTLALGGPNNLILLPPSDDQTKK